MKRFLITAIDPEIDDLGRDADTVLYWNVLAGWVSTISEATIWDEDEKEYCPLPPGGAWLDVTKELVNPN